MALNVRTLGRQSRDTEFLRNHDFANPTRSNVYRRKADWLVLLSQYVALILTSKIVARAETILLCQKKKSLSARERTSAKANHPPPRRANLCAKRWNTFGKASMAPVRQSKRSPLVSPKRVGPESSCRLQNAAQNEQRARQSAISKRAAPDNARSLRERGREQQNARLNARAVAQRQGKHCPDTRSEWRGNARHAPVRPLRRKQRGQESVAAEI